MNEETTMIKANDFFTNSDNLEKLSSAFLSGLGDSTNASDLLIMLTAKYRPYDFAYYDNDECYQAIVDVFNINAAYYKEMLTNYKKEYDYTTGITKITTNEGENTELLVDLPNKVIDSNDYFKYPSNANNDKQSLTVTQTDPSRMIYLKNQYLRQVRNLIDEFSEKFRILFMNTY